MGLEVYMGSASPDHHWSVQYTYIHCVNQLKTLMMRDNSVSKRR